ncbi:MAG: glycoside hydrolase family 65 protein [Candidatus Limnocylindrales bacterium]
MHLPKTPINYFRGDPWTIVEEGFDPAYQRVSESVFSVANEFMGVRGYFEEGYSGDHLLGSYFNHLYELMDIRHDQVFKGFVTKGAAMINAVDWLYTRIWVDGEQLDLAKSAFSSFTRRLDMRTGVLTRDFVWATATGKHLRVTFTRFTDMQSTRLGCQRIVLEPLDFSGTVNLRVGLDFNTHYEIGAGWDQTGGAELATSDKVINFWSCVRRSQVQGGWAIQGETLRSGHQLFSGFLLRTEQAVQTSNVIDDKFIGADFSLSLEQGRPTMVDRIAVNDWKRTADDAEVWAGGLELMRRQAGATFDSLMAEHVAFWQRTWDVLDIDIEGDPEVLQGLRFSSFQTYQSYHGEDADLNALCKGMTGEVYFGWAFWDSEIYSHRLMMFVDPDVARNLLLYRYHRLGQAMERARQLDCEGARFPFATITGTEDSGTWQHVDIEIHSDLAVAYAIWHHDVILRDKEFLYREGVEMLLQICRFLASWGGWSPSKGDFGFYGVMGPDEFHMMVNHNCYTNVLGKKTFEFTLAVLDEMKAAAPELYREALAKTNLAPKEPERWAEMAQKMRIPKDEKTGILEQHAGYFDLPHVDLEHFPADQIPIYKNWAYVKIFRYDMVKQPDVLNLMYFFSQDYTLEEKRANYDFYEARTIHESSLSPSLHAILAAELGKLDDAYTFFSYGARMDLDNYNRNTEQGLHVTSAAGVWASMIFGYGGMRTDGDILVLAPALAAKWRSYRFRVRYRGALLEVRVDPDEVHVRTLAGGPVTVRLYGSDCEIDSEGVAVAQKQPGD